MDFAKTINMPSSFTMVMVSELKDLKMSSSQKLIEVLVVYSAFLLKMLLRKPDSLESLLALIQNLQPCVMVVIGVEANHN